MSSLCGDFEEVALQTLRLVFEKEVDTRCKRAPGGDLELMITMENELGKEKPNYRQVDALMSQVLPNLGIQEMKFQRILYRYKVNYTSKKNVFSVDEIVKELDSILQETLSSETRQTVLHFKILFLAENDREWA